MSRLCRLRNASHGDEGQWAYSEIVGLREQVEFWQKEAAGRRDDMANYTRIVSETIDRLNVEVSKLTKERDIKEHCITQFELEDLRMKEQLAALAEQNAKMREALVDCEQALDECRDYPITYDSVIEALSLPDLANSRENKLIAEDVSRQLAALAEQNAKFRETLSRWRYQNLSYNWCCGNCGAVDGDEHKEGCALSLPDLASPVLNRIKAEAYREVADIVENIDVYTFVHGGSSYDDGGLTLSSAATAIRAKAAELEKGEPA